MKALFFLMVLAPFAFSAVVYDASYSTTGTNTLDITYSHITTSNADRVMCLGIAWDTYSSAFGSSGCSICDGFVYLDSITYNGVGMTWAGSNGYTDVYCLANPASGSHVVEITFLQESCDNGAVAVVGTTTWSGASGWGNFKTGTGTSALISVSITGNSTSNALWDAPTIGSTGSGTPPTITPVAGQTENWNGYAGNRCGYVKGGSSRKNGLSGATTMNWTISTSKTWFGSALEIFYKAAAPPASVAAPGVGFISGPSYISFMRFSNKGGIVLPGWVRRWGKT